MSYKRKVPCDCGISCSCGINHDKSKRHRLNNDIATSTDGCTGEGNLNIGETDRTDRSKLQPQRDDTGRNMRLQNATSEKDDKDLLQKNIPSGVCVKVRHLRLRGYENLQQWSAMKGHVMVTRHGRVFIMDPCTKKRSVFAYKGSPWANPFKLKHYSLEESLSLFGQHLNRLLDEEERLAEFKQLMSEATELGCFCDPGSKCHRDVLISKMRTLASHDCSKQPEYEP